MAVLAESRRSTKVSASAALSQEATMPLQTPSDPTPVVHLSPLDVGFSQSLPCGTCKRSFDKGRYGQADQPRMSLTN